jgi:hypothetical protein
MDRRHTNHTEQHTQERMSKTHLMECSSKHEPMKAYIYIYIYICTSCMRNYSVVVVPIRKLFLILPHNHYVQFPGQMSFSTSTLVVNATKFGFRKRDYWCEHNCSNTLILPFGSWSGVKGYVGEILDGALVVANAACSARHPCELLPSIWYIVPSVVGNALIRCFPQTVRFVVSLDELRLDEHGPAITSSHMYRRVGSAFLNATSKKKQA